MPVFGAGWTTGHIVLPNGVKRGMDVIEDPELMPAPVPPHLQFSFRFWRQQLRWNGLPGNQLGKLNTGHLRKRIQVTHLVLKLFISTLKPEALSCPTVNTQRSTDGITVPSALQHVLLWEDLDSFPLPATLNRDTQPQGKAANVDTAIPRWERLCHEYPEIPSSMAILKGRLHPILPEVEA